MIDVEKLNVYLEKKGYSQEDAARITGVDSQTFLVWINERNMPVDKVEILIKELEITNPEPIFFDGKLLVR